MYMMYNITKKYFHQLLDGLNLVLLVDVREGDQHVPEVLEIISRNRSADPVPDQNETDPRRCLEEQFKVLNILHFNENIR